MSPTDDGDSETVQACPACDSSSVATNNIGGIQSVNPDADRYLFTRRIPPFTAGVNPTLADQSTDDTLAGYSTVIDIIK